MKKLLKESLFEDEQDENPKSSVNIEDEMNYFVDMEDALKDDPESAKQFLEAIEEFGVDKKDIGIISSFGAHADWDDIKNELDRKQIEYYEFDTDDGESSILFNVNDLQNEKNEKEFKRKWGGGGSF